VTDKGSQDDTDAGTEVHFPTGVLRSVGGPPTGGSGASHADPEQSEQEQLARETPTSEEAHPDAEPPQSSAAEAAEPSAEPPSSDDVDDRSYLPPVFEAAPHRSYFDDMDPPSTMSLRSDEADEPLPEPAPTPTEPAAPRQEAQSPAFTSAAFDLFFPPDSDTPPTYQTREHQSYSLRPTTEGLAFPPVVDTAEPPGSEGASRKERAIELFWLVARYAGYAAVGYLALVLVLILLFRFVNPPASSLMLSRWLTGNSVDRTWVPINQVSRNLIRAVVVAEDGRFCEHAGIDFQAIGQAIEQAGEGTPRGASTISMQVTKNMFLWSSKSYIRKIIELPLTLIMELVWPKWRTLEVYLNIAEWGPGVFGAEAAARHHFNLPAARLSERQAALLAAALPNPIVRDAGDPSSLVSRKARIIQARMRASGNSAAACVLSRM
jgi:monofunctional biosynthetic peptidoglycan transglycosylase